MQFLYVRLITPSCQSTFYTLHDSWSQSQWIFWRRTNFFYFSVHIQVYVQRECPSTQKLYIFCTLFHLLETVHFLYTFLQYLSSFLTAPQSSLLIKRKYIIRPYSSSRAVITTHLWSWKGSYDPFFISFLTSLLSKRLLPPLSLQEGLRFCFCPWAQGVLSQTNAEWQW